MEQSQTLHEAAIHYSIFVKKPDGKHSDTFEAGADWQKEQDRQLVQALEAIANWPGNLPDERYLSATGPNDAALRGSMVVTMRSLAKEALEKFNSIK